MKLNDLDLEGLLATPPFTIISNNEDCQFLQKKHPITNIIQFNIILIRYLQKQLQVPKYINLQNHNLQVTKF